MPNVEMTIDLDALWTRHHEGATTPDDVRRVLLAYMSVQEEANELRARLDVSGAALVESHAILDSFHGTSGSPLPARIAALCQELEAARRVVAAARGVMEQGVIGGYTRMVLSDALAVYDEARKA